MIHTTTRVVVYDIDCVDEAEKKTMAELALRFSAHRLEDAAIIAADSFGANIDDVLSRLNLPRATDPVVLSLVDRDGNRFDCYFILKEVVDSALIGRCTIDTDRQKSFVRGVLKHYDTHGLHDDTAVLSMAHHYWDNVAVIYRDDNGDVRVKVAGYDTDDDVSGETAEELLEEIMLSLGYPPADT